MDSSKPNNKIREIVRLQQMLKKWKKLAVSPKNSSKKGSNDVPKGFFAVCVGEEMKRFVIPTEYLHHRAFAVLLREAEEEYGFQQEGVLRIPCGVHVFQSIMEVVQKKKKKGFNYCSSEAELESYQHPQNPMCR